MTHKTAHFSIRFYFQALSSLLGTPGSFFRELPADTGIGQSLGFLVTSSAFFTGASLLTRQFPSPAIAGGVFFVNAIGMTLISAGLGYMLMTMIEGRSVNFRIFFSIYAFASGVVLLASWIPLFVWLTEPWRWTLVGIGLTKTCGLKWLSAIIIIVISIAVMMLFFWSLLPLIQ